MKGERNGQEGRVLHRIIIKHSIHQSNGLKDTGHVFSEFNGIIGFKDERWEPRKGRGDKRIREENRATEGFDRLKLWWRLGQKWRGDEKGEGYHKERLLTLLHPSTWSNSEMRIWQSAGEKWRILEHSPFDSQVLRCRNQKSQYDSYLLRDFLVGVQHSMIEGRKSEDHERNSRVLSWLRQY